MDFRSRANREAAIEAGSVVAPRADRRRRILTRLFGWGGEALPLASIALLAALVAALVLLADRQERETRRLDLVRDALWVGEALDFALSSQREAVQRLAEDTQRGGLAGEAFAARARTLSAAYAEFAALALVEAGGEISAGAQDRPDSVAQMGLGAEEFATARAASTVSRHAVITGVVRPAEGGPALAIVAPASAQGAAGAFVVAQVSLDKLLAQQAPWWVAERLALAIVDADDEPLARRARGEADPAIAPHKSAFGPIAPGLFLTVAAYARPSNVTQNALLGAIAAMAIVAAASLWARARHLARRRESERRLREETAFRRSMEDSLTIGMRARDLEGRIISVNAAFERMVGWSEADLVGRAPPMPYWREEDIARTRALHDKVLVGDMPDQGMEFRFRRRDGVEFDALVYEAPLIDAEGAHRGWIGSFLDITARRQAEALAREQSETLERTARLVTIGEMASLVAHELNQPLAAISSWNAGMLNLLAQGEADPDVLRGALERSAEAAQRAGRILRRVQDFVRRSEPRFEPLDLAALAAECVERARREHRDGEIALDVTADAPAQGDRILIEQVIVNLLRNAAEAAQAQGAARRIRVTVRRIDDEIELAVRDNGPGLPPDVAARLFTPFQTTKEKGMGLGLTICRSIVEVHGGRLTGANAPGGGAAFAFRLRLAEQGEAATTGAPTGQAA
ncbi:MAG: PAS domain S-box protein [Methylobacteriaceae bacterium]|nr:PAS domain S-box protein [Methylobacteriaceae bacterium]